MLNFRKATTFWRAHFYCSWSATCHLVTWLEERPSHPANWYLCITKHILWINTFLHLLSFVFFYAWFVCVWFISVYYLQKKSQHSLHFYVFASHPAYCRQIGKMNSIIIGRIEIGYFTRFLKLHGGDLIIYGDWLNSNKSVISSWMGNPVSLLNDPLFHSLWDYGQESRPLSHDMILSKLFKLYLKFDTFSPRMGILWTTVQNVSALL